MGASLECTALGFGLGLIACLTCGNALAELPAELKEAPILMRSAGRESTLDLSALQGKVVYVDFWASWCAPCRASFPWLEAMHRKYAQEGLVILGINKDQENGAAERFLERHAVTFPLLHDPDDKLAKGLAVKGMPSSYLFDRRGHLRHRHIGFRQESTTELEQKIVQMLRENIK